MARISPEKKLLLTKMVEGNSMPTSDVVQLLASHDTLAKKLTCYHIADKCSTNADLALLTANLLLRDASDANPSVRSASISALAALPGIEESSVRAIFSALSDQAAMVRRAGAVACVRLYSHAPQSALESGVIDILYEGLRDSDPIVITNCILALEHILQNEGGLVVNKNIAMYLLGRIMQFSECNAVYVLSLLLRYTPKTEEELILLLNALDELLLSKASAVLVATVKLFLHWTKDHPHLMKDMLEMIQPSVCKILGRNVPETSYLMLEFLSTLGDIQNIFGPHYKYFLVRAKDPGYLKTQKLKVLPLVSTENNVCSLIEEVKPFCSDYQSFRGAVTCMGALAQVSTSAHELCLSILVTLLDAPTERLVIAALECLLTVVVSLQIEDNSICISKEPVQSSQSVGDADANESQVDESTLLPSSSADTPKPVTQKTIPELPQDLIQAVTRALSRGTVQETAPSLVLHVLGTLAPYLNSAPDILQSMLSLASSSEFIHADLVTTAARIFLCRPAQSQLLLAAILVRALKIPGEPASRAALVYSSLLEGPADAAQLLGVDSRYITSSTQQCEKQVIHE
ncbi:AP-4 complex subunit beta-1-like [Homarus americanus]|uniref:AP-4 complex subunit beta-1-like n=1 Tax=Homarus americanus TaxID=6706 RepID=UPI001C485156|nr:AP-4 complex subunit beta-1-like [Homarus americanus]